MTREEIRIAGEAANAAAKARAEATGVYRMTDQEWAAALLWFLVKTKQFDVIDLLTP